MNCYVSLLQVLGPNILSWVCPTSRHIGSGLRFRTAYDNLTGALTSKWSWSLANFGIALVVSELLSVKLWSDGWVLILWWWLGWAACRSPSMYGVVQEGEKVLVQFLIQINQSLEDAKSCLLGDLPEGFWVWWPLLIAKAELVFPSPDVHRFFSFSFFLVFLPYFWIM
jgi:hypothetical protein